MKDFLKRNEYPIIILGVTLAVILWMYFINVYTVSPLRQIPKILAALNTMNEISEEAAKMNVMYNHYYRTIKDSISTNNARIDHLFDLNREVQSEIKWLGEAVVILNTRIINLESNLACLKEAGQ